MHRLPSEPTVARNRAAEPVNVTVYQPLPDGEQMHVGRLLGETLVDGALHHYRVSLGGFVLICPPHWIALDSHPAIREAGLTLPTLHSDLAVQRARETVQ